MDYTDQRMKESANRRIDGKLVEISVGSRVLTVSLASTSESRIAGLADTEDLPNDGMLFMYTEQTSNKYDMKKMKYDISIHFFAGAGQFISSFRTDQTDLTVIQSSAPYFFALETYTDVEPGPLKIRSMK